MRRMSSLDDVDFDEADHARIDYLSSGDLTREEAERIVRFAKVDPSERSPDMLSAVVTDRDAAHETGVCADVRRLMRDADRPSEVCAAYPDLHPSRIFAHAEGRCGCDTDVDPTTSPRVGKDECADMRDAFRDGATKADIEADFNRSTNAVNKHLFGRCDHDVDRDDQISSTLSAVECARARDVYRRNDRTDFEALAAAFRVVPSTVHRHVRGECDHEVSIPPVDSGTTARSSCADMRRRYKSAAAPCVAAIARDFETSRPTAEYHIFGRCGCDHDEAAVSRDEG